MSLLLLMEEESLPTYRIMDQQQPLSYSLSASASSPPSSENESNPSDAVIFFGLSLALGIACRHLLRGTRVPYTVALLILGIALGSLEYGTHHRLGKIGDGIRLWSEIDPELLLAVFLPALLFESSFSMEVHQIKRCIAQMIILAGPGVVISTIFLGSVLKLTFPYNWSWKTSLLLGGLLSATDPVAVVALLKDLGASKKLSTIIEGESLMNDGTAIVVYTLFYRMVLGETFNWATIIKFLAQVSLGAVGIGLAFGIASVLWLGFIFNDTVIEISLTLAVSYVAYYTAQESADVSGVLTVMSLGMFYSAFARTAFKGESQQSLHHFWEMIAYIANTIIFILSGVVIAEGILGDDKVFHHGKSWVYLLLLYAYVQVSRCIVVGTLFPFLRYFGYGLDWKEAIILVWSGLRGAVALSLSLSVKRSGGRSIELTPETGTMFVFFTGGIVFLTLIVNGSTTQFILHFLDMNKLSSAKRRILEFTKYEMLNKALEAFGELGDDEELGPADWPTVKRYISCLNDIEGEGVHPHRASESDSNLDPMNLKDIRIRLLNGVQAAYWEMLDEGRITQTTANILMLSVEESIDLASSEPLCDWKGLEANVRFPSYYKFLQSSMFPPKLVTFFTVERLESACYICAAFLRAHRIARQQLHDFIGDSDIASAVINESVVEGEEARKFLEDVNLTYPQVLRVVKTRQATYVVLNHLLEYVQNLENAGILEEKEMLHLHDAVQTDLKKLLRNPPMVKLPKISNIHPMLDALPSSVRGPLVSGTKEAMKLRGLTLYKEGAKSNGIWLISNGVVKLESKMIQSKHPFYPTFTHGSTLGLYEVLSGRPYICNVVTDSVVFSLFVEANKIISCLKSDPSMEDFLWQESAIFLSKLLLPQIFEKLTVQDLRALIAERSEMTIYIRGETMEIPYHSVAFLLEGYVKPQGQSHQELVTAPAALVPSHGNRSFLNLSMSGTKEASFIHQGSCYLAEARARIIVFDIAAFEPDAALVKKSSSGLLHAADHPHKSFRRHHSALMSWPEHFYRQNQHKQSSEQQSNSLSARAMQLSIYGSMVDIPPTIRSLLTNRAIPPPQSLSYPTFEPRQSRPLGAVKSEGAAPSKKNIGVKGFMQDVTNLPSQSTDRRVHREDDSSDDSAIEEDIIVRIDSPSTLSFPQS
ncbi:putative potassium channel, voltage-dependent, ERG, cation/H+ exchanger [Medicago truncatula]|uniref:Putative potassium channel, voltage-dependent, ERG, cation/H+ exchanger n=1 Tax=Medicago truncatula TaxID=3880 RepID=A0A396GS19_MEDTR|nr:sodium/hydrogen exchanger 8 [Medicago truncatula]RHN42304.1 putative potassium channel, voltage-dependent, ERG, cation/H+ exchanger [Medicago truncatula]